MRGPPFFSPISSASVADATTSLLIGTTNNAQGNEERVRLVYSWRQPPVPMKNAHVRHDRFVHDVGDVCCNGEGGIGSDISPSLIANAVFAQ